MKLFAVNWQSFLSLLEGWEGLAAKARLAYLNAHGDADQLADSQFGSHLDSLLDCGLLVQRQGSEGSICSIPRNRLEFRRILLKLKNVQLFEEPSFSGFQQYASKHLPGRCYTSLINRRWSGNSRRADLEALFETVCGEEWIRGILELDQAIEFEYAHLNSGERRFFLTPRLLRQTQELIRLLSQSQSPIPFRVLRQTFHRMELPMLLSAGLRYMVFYPALHTDNLEPMLGLWPQVVKRLNAPAPQRPSPVEAEQEFSAAFLLDDMTKVLVACSNRPLRLRGNDGRLFARQYDQLSSQLIPIPDWLEESLSFDPAQRIGEALIYLTQLGLIDQLGTAGQDLRLEVNPTGKRWLSRPTQERLGGLIDAIRGAGEAGYRSFLPWDIAILSPDLQERPDLDEAVAKCFRDLPRSEFFEFYPFGLYHRALSNPLLDVRQHAPRFSLSLGWKRFNQLSNERLEQIWYNLLLEFLRQRLIPLGGVRVGHSGKGNLCFALTEAGLYLLGETDHFDYQRTAEGEILVQPNFEVVFLAPSPLAEAEIGRFARRSGNDVGLLFKLTKSSVISAVGSGLSARQIIQTLSGFSSKEIPSNVEKEIRAWAGQCRRINLDQVLLIRCPDADTAGKVASLAGKKARLLNETTLELSDPKAKASLLNRLRKAGVFLED